MGNCLCWLLQMALTEPLDSDGCNSTSGYCIDPEQKLNASGLLQRRTAPESSSELMHGRFGFQTTILVLAVLALLLLAYAWYPRQSATEPSSNVRKKRKARESKKMK